MQKGNKNYLFEGQTIYSGIDIHNKNWKVTILSAELEHKTITQPPEAKVLGNYLKRNFPGARYKSVYESGYHGFWIDELLKKEGIENIVVNPADVPTSNKQRKRKTDKVDSRKLGRELRNNNLEGIYVLSREKQEHRSLVRMRSLMVKKQTRCKNQIKAYITFYGEQKRLDEEVEEKHWSKNYIKYLENLKFKTKSGEIAFRYLLVELKRLRGEIAEISKEIKKLSDNEIYNEDARLLLSIPGISTISAMIILTEIEDINRFKNLDHIASYCRLIPDEDSSGEQERKGAITRRGNSNLKHMLIEASWIAVRKDPALMRDYQLLIKRMKKTQAIVRISKKLLNRIRFVLRNKEPYKILTIN